MSTVVIAGASGTIGLAAVRAFAADPGHRVVGLSRRAPLDPPPGLRHLPLDLRDRTDCERQLTALGSVTHLVFTAAIERPGLVAGWQDRELMAQNLAIFRHVLDPLLAAGSLEHVSLLQGGKAYGFHLGHLPLPARERAPRHEHANFYFLQEDYLRERQGGWSWTILRPQAVYGEALGGAMNLIPALGAYGAVLRELGQPFGFPGGPDHVSEAVDADLVGRALRWSATAEAARNETFNITNGDVFSWRECWPVIADALGMPVGPDEPMSLAAQLNGWAPVWRRVVERYRLRSPVGLADLVGESFAYADMLLGQAGRPPSPPALMSTIKLRTAGFGECVDTSDMFRTQLRRLQERRLLPPRA